MSASVKPADPNGLDVRLNLIYLIVCFFICIILHHYLSKRICMKLFPSYAKLSWQLQMEWDSRIVSSIHASLVTAMSFYSLAFEQPLWDNKIDGPTRLGGITVSISAAYMLADAVSMPIYWRDINLLVFWLHHFIAVGGFYICGSMGLLQFFALFRLLSELSTPFLNVNWYNRLCNVSTSSLLNLGNSICLSASYLACRLLAIPIYWFYFVQCLRTDAFRRLASEAGVVTFVWIASSVILDVLNILWAKSILIGSLQSAKKGLQLRRILS